jgi:hypothetical protein
MGVVDSGITSLLAALCRAVSCLSHMKFTRANKWMLQFIDIYRTFFNRKVAECRAGGEL